jgi:mannose-6-phosphate isomerase-like protein (cupin superfamily)
MSLITKLESEISNKDYFDNNSLLYINQSNDNYFVKDHFSYEKWINNYKNIASSILVRDIEKYSSHKKDYFELYKDINVQNIHLFYNIRGGVSFKDHTDDENVYLNVLQGFKRVYMLDSVFTVKANESIIIQRKTLHRVESVPETWALSIAF